MGFIRIFTMVAGILLILSSIPTGISSIDPEVLGDETEILRIVTDKIIIGQFITGALPILWMGLGAIFAGILLSNWIGGVPRQITDILRIVVLAALYPITSQFILIMMNGDVQSITLVPPLLAGLAATLVSATILFRKYRKHKHQEMIVD
jgi:putative membrane protein